MINAVLAHTLHMQKGEEAVIQSVLFFFFFFLSMRKRWKKEL